MKKLVLSALVAFSVMTPVFADEPKEATVDMLNKTIESCKQWAVEDEVAKEELDQYMLECVNDVLTSNGFKAVTTLKQDK
jgi:flagellar biosynthesis protein FliP